MLEGVMWPIKTNIAYLQLLRILVFILLAKASSSNEAFRADDIYIYI